MKILIVRVGAMGDILHALPAVTALRAALPAAHIGWAVEPHWAPLLSPALVDQIHLVPTRDWKERPLSLRTLRQILSLRRDFKQARYDLAVDLQGSIRSGFLARLGGAPRVFGPAVPREEPARVFYTHRVALHRPSVIDQAAELLGAATGLNLSPAKPIIAAGEDVETPTAPFILIAPTAGWGAKQWPLEKYHALIDALPGPILINSLTPNVAYNTKALCTATTLPQLIALTRRAALVIGGDTGPIHLAAALGRPTLALFGPTDPARNGPNFPGAIVKVLRHPSSTLSHKRTADTEPGLARITVEEVLQAAFELLATGEGA